MDPSSPDPPLPSLELNIRVKSPSMSTFPLTVSSEMTILELKQRIAAEKAVDTSLQRLIYRGRLLKDVQSISACQISEQSVVHLVINRPRENIPEESQQNPPVERSNVVSSIQNMFSQLMSRWNPSSPPPVPEEHPASVSVNVILSTSLNFSLLRDHIQRASNLIRDPSSNQNALRDEDSLSSVFEDIANFSSNDLSPVLRRIAAHLRVVRSGNSVSSSDLPDVASVSHSMRLIGRILSNIGSYLESEDSLLDPNVNDPLGQLEEFVNSLEMPENRNVAGRRNMSRNIPEPPRREETPNRSQRAERRRKRSENNVDPRSKRERR